MGLALASARYKETREGLSKGMPNGVRNWLIKQPNNDHILDSNNS